LQSYETKTCCRLQQIIDSCRGNHKLERVRQIASRSGQSINQMVNSWADMVIVQNEAEASLLAAAARGNPARELRLLEKLNRQDRKNRIAGTKP
jgi:hypothetical protein